MCIRDSYIDASNSLVNRSKIFEFLVWWQTMMTSSLVITIQFSLILSRRKPRNRRKRKVNAWRRKWENREEGEIIKVARKYLRTKWETNNQHVRKWNQTFFVAEMIWNLIFFYKMKKFPLEWYDTSDVFTELSDNGKRRETKRIPYLRKTERYSWSSFSSF